MKICVLLLLVLSLNIAFADKWAVLVAGSEGYWNYRHQADIAHAYRILINNGYKPEHVIVFANNDVPTSEDNPIPGTLYNKPGNNSINYNEDYVVDYQGKDVNTANYIKVLTGDESAGGKVLKSTEEDTIFLVYSDHGGPEVVGFVNDNLLREDLEGAFKVMKEKKMFKKIVYYLEACYSGTMFNDSPTDSGIYALTAANTDESSWGYYCSDAVVNGVEFDTCLGDEFSIQWMENVDEGDLTQTFKEHAELITAKTLRSHVSRYGDLSFENLPISEVITGDLATVKNGKKIAQEKIEGVRGDIYLNKLNYLRRKMEKSNDSQAEKEYNHELELIQKIDTYFGTLKTSFKNIQKISFSPFRGHLKNTKCYRQSIDEVNNKFEHSDYLFKYYEVLYLACNEYSDAYLYL
ncbi:hypothetical protein WA158_004584 [Blastocystis sp. Blastoise]